MKTRHVLLKLRLANKDDFADALGQKKYGTAYFEENSHCTIERSIKYFTPNTDLLQFKKLYANNQIYVMVNGNEAEIIDEENKLKAIMP